MMIDRYCKCNSAYMLWGLSGLILFVFLVPQAVYALEEISPSTMEETEMIAMLEPIVLEGAINSQPLPEEENPSTETSSELPPADEFQSIDTVAINKEKTSVEEASSEPSEPSSDELLVTNLFYDTPIRDALSDIAAQVGVVIIPDISVQGLVTCELNDKPLSEALDIILSSGNFSYRQMEGYILVGSLHPESPTFIKMCDTKTILLEYANAEDVVKTLPTPLKTYASFSTEANSVTLMAPPDIIEMLSKEIEKLEIPPRQVILDVRIVAIESGDLLNLGVNWDWPSASMGAFSNSDQHESGAAGGSWPWGLQVGYTPGKEFTNSVNMSLNLLAQNDEITVIANPTVLAQDRKEAQIAVTTEEYYKILTEGFYRGNELEKIDSGTTLTITPFIRQNDEVTLDIAAEVSNVVARGEDNLPVVTRRNAKSTVRVQDGGTIVLGGLLANQTSRVRDKTPGLSRIPFVGGVFSNNSKSDFLRQITIFVTPRIVEVKTEPVPKKPKKQSPYQLAGDDFTEEIKDILAHDNKG